MYGYIPKSTQFAEPNKTLLYALLLLGYESRHLKLSNPIRVLLVCFRVFVASVNGFMLGKRIIFENLS